MKLVSRFWADLSTLDFKRLAAHAQLGEVAAELPT